MKDIENKYGNGHEEMPLSEAIEREALKAAGMLDDKKEDAAKAAAEQVMSQAQALAQKERELAERERALRERELQIKRQTLSENGIRDIYRDPNAPDIYFSEDDLEDDEYPEYEDSMRRDERAYEKRANRRSSGDRYDDRRRPEKERRDSTRPSRSSGKSSGRYDDRSDRRDNSKAERKTQLKKDKKQAKKEAKRREKNSRPDRKRDDGRKKKHPFRRFLLILLLILMIPVAYILIKFRQMHIGGLSVSDLKGYISEEVKNSAKSGAMAGYKNIALFGVDSIEGSLEAGNNRTDIMIIASINEKTGDVKLVSLYRDTYLDIGDGNYQKANAAFAYGGPERAVKMLNTNLDLNISDYVVTGFEGIATAIDAVGGIDIDVSEEEIHFMNDYQSTMAQETGMTYVPVTQAGPQTLTGLQATAYCRIRYTEGGDFKRTERQKEVLSKTFDKLKSAGPLTMVKVADAVMSKVRTSLNMTEIAAMAAQAMNYHIADTNGIPVEQFRAVGYIGDQSCVIPVHLTDNVVWLHQYLFNDSEYQVSSTVQQISDHVSAASGR